jgi:hypothetical protein
LATTGLVWLLYVVDVPYTNANAVSESVAVTVPLRTAVVAVTSLAAMVLAAATANAVPVLKETSAAVVTIRPTISRRAMDEGIGATILGLAARDPPFVGTTGQIALG